MLSIFSKAPKYLSRYCLFPLLIIISTVSIAQQFTDEQIEAFRKLPLSQQKALAKQFGIDDTLLDTLNQDNNGSVATTLEQPELVLPLDNVDDNNLTSEDDTDEADATEDISTENLIDFKTRLDDLIDDEKSSINIQQSRNIVKKLKAFGYDVFAGVPTTFAPATDVPIPMEYKLGPGDTLSILLSGQINRTLNLTINRAGMINASEIGMLTLTGMSFSDATNLIVDKIKEKNIGVSVHVSMGELRSIRIFILGEANRPGSYTVSALSTLTNALFVSGGIKESGSLRKIQLKRSGKVVTEFDLYDLLVLGDNQNDARIMAGDVIFIPPVGRTVSVQGEVSREAIFELKNEETIADLEILFGGYKPTAFLNKTKIERIDGLGGRTVKDIGLNTNSGRKLAVRNGDIIKIPSVLDESNNIISIEGHVYRPGDYAFNSGMKLSDVIYDSSHFLTNIDLNYALIKKESLFDKSVSFEQFTVRELLNGQSVEVAPNDTVYFFDATKNRESLLSDSLTQLSFQNGLTLEVNTITVNGAVNFPGTYPHSRNMTVLDALYASGNVDVSASKSFAVLLQIDAQQNTIPTILNLNRPTDLEIPVGPQSSLYIFTKSGDRALELEPVITLLQEQSSKKTGGYEVTIQGEVKFPGVYPFVSGMSLSDLITAAGGLKNSAFIGETEISRFEFSNKDAYNRKILQVNLATELSSPTITIQPRDVLLVKPIPGWEDEEYIELVGEFKFPGRYLIQKGETLAQVFKRAGGLSDLAYPGASLFFRESVAEQQRIEILRLNTLLEKQLEIALAKKSASGLGGVVSNANSSTRVADLIAETSADGLGRISIDLTAQLLGNDTPLEVFSNDRIVVPRKPSTVQVIGEVNRTTSNVYSDKLDLIDYVEMAGGTTEFANVSELYIIRADGRVIIPDSSWFSYNENTIKPGDTIVIPFDASLRDNFNLWQQVTQIIYNSAVSLAAIKGL